MRKNNQHSKTWDGNVKKNAQSSAQSPQQQQHQQHQHQQHHQQQSQVNIKIHLNKYQHHLMTHVPTQLTMDQLLYRLIEERSLFHMIGSVSQYRFKYNHKDTVYYNQTSADLIIKQEKKRIQKALKKKTGSKLFPYAAPVTASSTTDSHSSSSSSNNNNNNNNSNNSNNSSSHSRSNSNSSSYEKRTSSSSVIDILPFETLYELIQQHYSISRFSSSSTSSHTMNHHNNNNNNNNNNSDNHTGGGIQLIELTLDPQLDPNHFTSLFGQPLEFTCKNYFKTYDRFTNDSITMPQNLQYCFHYLNHHGDVTFNTQGIFRVNGSHAQMEKYRLLWTQGIYDDPIITTHGTMDDNSNTSAKKNVQENVLNIAGVLKLYLRQLPEPLIEHVFFKNVKNLFAVESITDERRLNGLRNLIHELSLSHYIVLEHLMALCHKIQKNSHVNSMTSQNLATCLSPNILYDPVQVQPPVPTMTNKSANTTSNTTGAATAATANTKPSLTPKEMMQLKVQETRIMNDIVAFMIDNYTSLFTHSAIYDDELRGLEDYTTDYDKNRKQYQNGAVNNNHTLLSGGSSSSSGSSQPLNAVSTAASTSSSSNNEKQSIPLSVSADKGTDGDVSSSSASSLSLSGNTTLTTNASMFTNHKSGIVNIEVIRGINLIAADSNGTSDPYVLIELNKQISSTRFIHKTLNPVFMEQFDMITNDYTTDVIKISVYDRDKLMSDDLLGRAEIKLSSAPHRGKKQVFHVPLSDVKHGSLEIAITPVNYGQWIERAALKPKPNMVIVHNKAPTIAAPSKDKSIVHHAVISDQLMSQQQQVSTTVVEEKKHESNIPQKSIPSDFIVSVSNKINSNVHYPKLCAARNSAPLPSDPSLHMEQIYLDAYEQAASKHESQFPFNDYAVLFGNDVQIDFKHQHYDHSDSGLSLLLPGDMDWTSLRSIVEALEDKTRWNVLFKTIQCYVALLILLSNSKNIDRMHIHLPQELTKLVTYLGIPSLDLLSQLTNSDSSIHFFDYLVHRLLKHNKSLLDDVIGVAQVFQSEYSHSSTVRQYMSQTTIDQLYQKMSQHNHHYSHQQSDLVKRLSRLENSATPGHNILEFLHQISIRVNKIGADRNNMSRLNHLSFASLGEHSQSMIFAQSSDESLPIDVLEFISVFGNDTQSIDVIQQAITSLHVSMEKKLDELNNIVSLNNLRSMITNIRSSDTSKAQALAQFLGEQFVPHLHEFIIYNPTATSYLPFYELLEEWRTSAEMRDCIDAVHIPHYSLPRELSRLTSMDQSLRKDISVLTSSPILISLIKYLAIMAQIGSRGELTHIGAHNMHDILVMLERTQSRNDWQLIDFLADLMLKEFGASMQQAGSELSCTVKSIIDTIHSFRGAKRNMNEYMSKLRSLTQQDKYISQFEQEISLLPMNGIEQTITIVCELFNGSSPSSSGEQSSDSLDGIKALYTLLHKLSCHSYCVRGFLLDNMYSNKPTLNTSNNSLRSLVTSSEKNYQYPRAILRQVKSMSDLIQLMNEPNRTTVSQLLNGSGGLLKRVLDRIESLECVTYGQRLNVSDLYSLVVKLSGNKSSSSESESVLHALQMMLLLENYSAQ